MKILGLTGNIACGKSTVASLLRQRGAGVVDADHLVHELYSDTAFAREVAALFSGEVLNSLGMVDRKKLSALVFGRPDALRRLEFLVHPAVAALREEKLRAFAVRSDPPAVVVLEAVKLLESGQGTGCDAIWCVTCSPPVQLQRLMNARQLTADEAQARLAAQPPLEEKEHIAAAIEVPLKFIPNNGTVEELELFVANLWNEFVASHLSSVPLSMSSRS